QVATRRQAAGCDEQSYEGTETMNEREETETINESGTYLRFLVDFWGNLAQDVAARMQTASEEIDHRRYTPTKLASDAMYALLGPMQRWVDACVGAGSAP